jgi:hypothetical protein
MFPSVPESSYDPSVTLFSPPGVLGDEVALGCLYLVTKPSQVGGLTWSG